MGARDGAAGKRGEKIVREFDQIGDFVTAVALVAGVKLFGFEVLSAGRFDDFAGEEFFDESGGIGFGSAEAAGEGRPAYLRSMRGDGLAKMGQLFGDMVIVRRLFATRFVPY